MNLNKKIKCGIIGCGRIFPKHYEIFSKKIIPNLQLIAVCDLKREKLNGIQIFLCLYQKIRKDYHQEEFKRY